MNRQSLAPLLVGVISVGSGLWVALQLRIGRCVDIGGRWDPLRRVCLPPEGVPPDTMQRTLLDYAIGGAVMLLFGYMLMRMWAAVQHKNRLRRERESGAPGTGAPGTGAPGTGARGTGARGTAGESPRA